MCQAGRVPQNGDSATQKQLVLVRTEENACLSDVLFPAASDLDSSGFPDPGDVAALWPQLISPVHSFEQPLHFVQTLGTPHLRHCIRVSSRGSHLSVYPE